VREPGAVGLVSSLSGNQREGALGKEKSILEKFTDTVKDIASTTTEAASRALKADEPGLKATNARWPTCRSRPTASCPIP